MSDFKLDIDLREALADIGRLKIDMEQLRGEMARVSAAGKEAFKAPALGAQAMAKEIDTLQREYNDIRAASETVKKALKNSFEPTAVKNYTRALEQADVALGELERTGKGVGVDLKKGFQDAQKSAQGASGGLGDVFGQFTKAGLIGVAIAKVAQFGAEAINLAEGYKKTEVAFDALLQGQAKGEDVIAQVNRFAAANGLMQENAQQAAKSLLAFGVPVDQLDAKLSQVADIAAGTGKDFNELATIFGKAKVAGTLYAEDINQLVDAGVPIIGEFAKILGVSADQVKKLGSEGKIGFDVLQQAFTNLTSEGGKFNDLAAKQAEITGSAARASSAWAETLRAVGAELLPIKNALLDFASGVLGGIGKLINPTKALNDEFAAQFDTVKKLDAQVPGLVAKYEGLSAKQTLTAAEQTELNDTIQRLSVLVPGAITGIDDYGKVLGVNLGIIKDYTKEQRALLATVTDDKLAEANDKLARSQGRVKGAQALATSATRTVQRVTGGAVSRVEEETVAVTSQERAAAVNAIKKENEEQLALTNTITELLRVKKQLNESNAVTADPAALAKQAEADAKAAAEAAKATGKARAEASKAAFDAEQRAERERAQLRADLLKDGIERDIALENIRAAAQRDALRKGFAGRKELQAVLEQAGAQHGRNIVDIQAKYAFEKIKEAAEAAEAEREAVERGFAELAEAEKQGREAVAKVRTDNAAVQKQAADLQKEIFEGQLLTAKEVFLEEQATETDRLNFLKESQARRAQFLKTPRTEEEVANFDAEERGRKLAFLAKQADDKTLAAYEKQVAKARELFQLAQQAEELQRTLDFDTTLTSAEKAALQQRRDNVLKEIEQVQAGIGDKAETPESSGFDIFKLLGASSDEEKERIKQAAAEITDAIARIAAAQVEAAAAAREAADERVSTAQDALDRELELAETGFASNVTLRQKELADAEAARNTAIEQQKKAARAQLAVEAAQQASGIATAAVKLYQTWATIPFGVGLIAAAAQVAGLIAAIASVRSRARSISSGQFRQGGSGYVNAEGVIVGPSHERGGVVVPEYEGGEFFASDGRRFAVVNKHMTEQHFELLRAVNRGDDGGIVTAAARIADLPALRRERGNDIASFTQQVFNGGSVTVNAEGFSKNERRDLLELLQTWQAKQGQMPQVQTDRSGATVIRQGTHTRKVS